MSIHFQLQDVGPSGSAGGNVGGPVPSPSSTNLKWLNVVLDLNGVLCVCEEKKFRPHGQRYLDSKDLHSATIPAAIGPKAVFVRPGCAKFLRDLAQFAHITIWSSMMKNTTEQICKYLFRGLPPPENILGQEHCDRIKVLQNRTITFLKVKGTRKDLFLKTLEKSLFHSFGGRYTKGNTIIVDDSPMKHLLNEPENVILLDAWSHKESGSKDVSLVTSLLPYLYRVHTLKPEGFQSFRRNERFGRQMMREDPFSIEYSELMVAVEKSERLSA